MFFFNFYRTQFLYLPTASSWKCVVIFQLMFVCVSAFQSRFPPTAFFCSSAIRLAAAFSLASLESVIPEADGDRLGFVSTSTRTRQPAKKPGKNSNNDNNNKKKTVGHRCFTQIRAGRIWQLQEPRIMNSNSGKRER